MSNKKIEIDMTGCLRKRFCVCVWCMWRRESSNEFAMAQNIFKIPSGKTIHKKYPKDRFN